MMMCFPICISVLYHSKRKLFQYRGKVIMWVHCGSQLSKVEVLVLLRRGCE